MAIYGGSHFWSPQRSEDGKRAWDTFMTLAETTRKLGVNFYAYLHDRITGANTIPPLADLITQAAGNSTLSAPTW